MDPTGYSCALAGLSSMIWTMLRPCTRSANMPASGRFHVAGVTLRSFSDCVTPRNNAAEVRRRLVPRETVAMPGGVAEVARTMSPDGRYVCKTIVTPAGRRFTERVRLFDEDQMSAMLRDAGVEARHGFGDYDAAPLRADSPRTILAGRIA